MNELDEVRISFINSLRQRLELKMKNKSCYSRIVIIFREGEVRIIPFEQGFEKEAKNFFEKASQQWSDSFLCDVLKGPVC